MIKQKFFIIIFIFFFSFLYVYPNIYGDKPVIIIDDFNKSSFKSLKEFKDHLMSEKIFFNDLYIDKNKLIIYFNSTENQFNSYELLKNNGMKNMSLNILEFKQGFLYKKLGIKPMKFGLDLRGGIYFLINVDFQFNIKLLLKMYVEKMKDFLDSRDIAYKKIVLDYNNLVKVYFNNSVDQSILAFFLQDFDLVFNDDNVFFFKIKHRLILELKKQIINQTIYIFNKRINELGISDSLVRKIGDNKVVIEIAGIQDIARAKKIIGKIATLKFMLVAYDSAIFNKSDMKKYYDNNNLEINVFNKSLLDGNSIIYASLGLDSFNKPCVNIKIKQSDASRLEKITRNNIGKDMAIIYKELVFSDNKEYITERVISVAKIMSALSTDFQITGLSVEEAKDLSLLLRSGSLPASVSIIKEKIIGPSIGEKNIKSGFLSIFISYIFIFFFMFYRYRFLGLIANFSLLANIFLLIMFMSIINVTLTLPGLAGIAITVGMGIDGNILIFERFKEECLKSSNIYINLENGFNSAFSSIFDANLTTLIIGLVLFLLGDGFIKGFAITLSLGVLTSMYGSLFVTKIFIDFFSLLKTRLI